MPVDVELAVGSKWTCFRIVFATVKKHYVYELDIHVSIQQCSK